MSNQNEFEMDGAMYDAVTHVGEDDECPGCAGDKNFSICNRLPVCHADDREDGRMVVWVRR